jgi:predicted DNA-binding protein
MKATMKRANVRLQKVHDKKLKVISVETGAPVGALIGKTIEQYLEKRS